MTDQSDQPSRRFRSGAVIAIAALTLVILAGGAFAVGRSTATNTAPRTTYSQTASGTGAGPMGTWMRQHRDDIAWMRQHPAQWQWIRHHPAQWSWMRDHMDDMPWLRAHNGQWQWLRNHPNAWTWMRNHMTNMMGGQGTWQR